MLNYQNQNLTYSVHAGFCVIDAMKSQKVLITNHKNFVTCELCEINRQIILYAYII